MRERLPKSDIAKIATTLFFSCKTPSEFFNVVKELNIASFPKSIREKQNRFFQRKGVDASNWEYLTSLGNIGMGKLRWKVTAFRETLPQGLELMVLDGTFVVSNKTPSGLAYLANHYSLFIRTKDAVESNGVVS